VRGVGGGDEVSVIAVAAFDDGAVGTVARLALATRRATLVVRPGHHVHMSGAIEAASSCRCLGVGRGDGKGVALAGGEPGDEARARRDAAVKA